MKVLEAKAEFARYLREKGLRETSQRSHIVDTFLATDRHLTIEQLHSLVRHRHKDTGYATVSRTVKLMDEAGICRCVDFGDGVARYEHKFGHKHHDHLICLSCGKFVEVYSPKLEKIQAELVSEHGYTHHHHKLDIFGLCPECGKSSKQP